MERESNVVLDIEELVQMEKEDDLFDTVNKVLLEEGIHAFDEDGEKVYGYLDLYY